LGIKELIQRAAAAKLSQRQLAKFLGVHEDMVSHWKSGRMKPNAAQIAQLAECAGLPVLETVAEVEAEIDEKNSEIWKRALRAIQGAGVAVGIATVVMATTPSKAEAALYKTELCSQCTYVLVIDSNDEVLPPALTDSHNSPGTLGAVLSHGLGDHGRNVIVMHLGGQGQGGKAHRVLQPGVCTFL